MVSNIGKTIVTYGKIRTLISSVLFSIMSFFMILLGTKLIFMNQDHLIDIDAVIIKSDIDSKVPEKTIKVKYMINDQYKIASIQTTKPNSFFDKFDKVIITYNQNDLDELPTMKITRSRTIGMRLICLGIFIIIISYLWYKLVSKSKMLSTFVTASEVFTLI